MPGPSPGTNEISLRRSRATDDLRSRALRRDAQVFVLVEHAVERVLVVLLDLEDADFPVGDVAVVVEADHTLQRLGLRGLDRVADIAAVDLLAPLGDALDGVEDDQRRVIGSDRVVLRLLSVFLRETLDPGL